MYTSIIIPTYNECENIIKLIQKVRVILSKQKIKHEIIIIDDNSPDKTALKIIEIFGLDKNIRLFVRKKERGLASAILYGIKQSKGKIIVCMDADFNHPPNKIIELISKLENYDLVVASRFIKGGGMEDKTRYLFTLIFNMFLKNILGFPTMDNMSGFYAIKKEKLLQLPLQYIYRGYGEYHLRLLYLVAKSHLKIKETPVFYPKRKYGKSKTRFFQAFFIYLIIAIKLRITSKTA